MINDKDSNLLGGFLAGIYSNEIEKKKKKVLSQHGV